ncbi:hypothetical protein [Metabacillus sp. FJAT-53654]|uniref:Uncharacterized protein n=1 Tax=Metabacillus rhizosphaerae TaxID=3117747 RepID=A0ABZ2MYM9_9BACI
MKGTRVKIIYSLEELNKFLSENDVLNVQMLSQSKIRESYMVGGGMVEEKNLYWNVWYK